MIIYQGARIGMLTAYWEDGKLQQWLEFGIAIYDSKLWSKGIGKQALRLWITYLFDLYPHIQRIGYTTWSGNVGMMRVGEALGMRLEARIRKVRYTQGQYFDSIKYGILREEFS